MSANPNVHAYQQQLQAAFTRRKHDPLPSLQLVLPLSELMDLAFCASLSTELKKEDRAWEVKNATPELWNQIPQTSGVYMFVLKPPFTLQMASTEKAVCLRYTLYVGKAGSRPGSSSLRSRYKSEYRNYVCQNPDHLWDLPEPHRREEMLRKYLNLYPLEYWYLEIQEIETIDRIEKHLIKVLNPPLNSQGRVKLKAGRPRPAFK